MLEVAVFLGFLAAHAIWSVSDGETLVPIYATLDADGGRHMRRLAADTLEESVNEGRKLLNQDVAGTKCAILIYDGYLSLRDKRTDALFLEARCHGDKTETISMAIPYTSSKDGTRFSVFRPKILQFPGRIDDGAEAFMEAFWRGVDSHEKGAAVWNAHIDQSR